MRKIFLFGAFFMLCSFLSFAQVTEYSFMGTLMVKGSRPYSFQLQFSDSAGTIRGVSITDMQGPDQTKTAITGTVDRKKKEFSFRETKIVSTRSKANRDSFCYIRAKLKLKERKGTKVLSGSFRGYMKDGVSSCGKGEITLVSKADILDKLMKLGPQADTIVKLMEKVDAAAAKEDDSNTEPQQRSLSVKPGGATTVKCEGDKAILELWDNSKIDGDIITLMHNEQTLLDHYTISNKKEQFLINVSGGSESIKLISEHEGSEPPTTVRLSCSCGNKTFTIDASSSIGKPIEIVIQ